MCLDIIAKFFAGKMPLIWVDGLRRWKLHTTVTRTDTDVCVIQGKRTKVPCFPYSPTFHEYYNDGFRRKNRKGCAWLVKGLVLPQKTELQAALVCTITEMQPGGGRAKITTLNKPTMKQCNSEQVQSNNVITHWSSQGDITQPRLFQSEAKSLWH